jgi:hypothetical protein
MWHPARATTFVLPVFEIEQIISQLQVSLRSTTVNLNVNGNTTAQIKKQISNWQTVLANYREHNSELTPIFSVENIMFTNITRAFNAWTKGIITDSDLVGVLDAEVDGKDAANYFKSFSQSFRRITDTCSNVIPQYQSSFVKAVCADFNPSHWTGFQSLLKGACDMPTTPNVDDPSPLKKSALVKSACQHRIAANAEDVPGGFTSDGTDDSLMGFMTSNEKYLTFGAKAPLELSWASSVSDSKAFSSNLDYSASKGSSESFTLSGSVTFAAGGITDDSGEDTSHSISIGKTSDSSHSFERSVTIVLDDIDYGITHSMYVHYSVRAHWLFLVLCFLGRRLLCSAHNRGSCLWHTCVHHDGRPVQVSGRVWHEQKGKSSQHSRNHP